MTISPALNGFLKGLLMVIVLGVADYLANAANLSPVLGSVVATLVAALASSIESHIKEQTGRGLLGVVHVR